MSDPNYPNQPGPASGQQDPYASMQSAPQPAAPQPAAPQQAAAQQAAANATAGTTAVRPATAGSTSAEYGESCSKYESTKAT